MMAQLPDGYPLEVGEYSHATLRSEDLIKTYIEMAEAILRSDHHGIEHRFKVAIRLGAVCGIKRRVEKADVNEGWHETYYHKSDHAANDIEDLLSMLDDMAPDGFYFGMTEGDGSSFGLWPIEED